MDTIHPEHPRRFESNRYVDPALRRRSGGLSIGIDLTPDKTCSFHCVYCQVDRSSEAGMQFVDSHRLLSEPAATFSSVSSCG